MARTATVPATNAPAAGWYQGRVEAYSDIWVTQTVWPFTIAGWQDGTAPGVYRRVKSNGTWGSWYRVVDSQSELDGRYASNKGGGKEVVAALSATTGTATGDLSAASVFTVTPTGNITLAFSNIPSGVSVSTTVIITQGASAFTVTMPAGTTWLQTAPTQVANKKCVINMLTVDGGTNWYATAAVQP